MEDSVAGIGKQRPLDCFHGSKTIYWSREKCFKGEERKGTCDCIPAGVLE